MKCKEFLNRIFKRDNFHETKEETSYDEVNTSSFIHQNKEDFDECVICLEKMKQGETLTIINCFHIYHKSCIDAWAQKNRICPICDYIF